MYITEGHGMGQRGELTYRITGCADSGSQATRRLMPLDLDRHLGVCV